MISHTIRRRLIWIPLSTLVVVSPNIACGKKAKSPQSEQASSPDGGSFSHSANATGAAPSTRIPSAIKGSPPEFSDGNGNEIIVTANTKTEAHNFCKGDGDPLAFGTLFIALDPGRDGTFHHQLSYCLGAHVETDTGSSELLAPRSLGLDADNGKNIYGGVLFYRGESMLVKLAMVKQNDTGSLSCLARSGASDSTAVVGATCRNGMTVTELGTTPKISVDGYIFTLQKLPIPIF